MNTRNILKIFVFVLYSFFAWFFFFGHQDATSIREISLKAKKENNDLRLMIKDSQESMVRMRLQLDDEQEAKRRIEREFTAYKGQFSIVDYQWMTNEVVTCHLALQDGQRSTNMGRWPVEWNARQKAWLQADGE